MTDVDVIERIAALWGRAVVQIPRRKAHHKDPFMTTIKGTPAVELMTALYPFMSCSRRTQIERAIASWRCGRRRRSDPSMLHIRPHPCGRECDVAWLAGLLEGEGHFGSSRSDAHVYPVLKLEMCDYDVVRRAADIIGVLRIHVRESREEHWGRTFIAQLSGGDAARWMIELRSLMGQRRGVAIDRALALYAPIRLVTPPKTCIVSGCDAEHRARGLCHKHYMTWMRDRARGREARIVGLR